MHVHLPVSQRFPDVLAIPFIRQRTAISFESSLDLLSFTVGDELCRLRVVLESPVSPAGNYDSDYALEDEDPGPTSATADAVQF